MHSQPLFSFATKIQFQHGINPVNAFMVPAIALPAQQLEQLLKTVARIAFWQFSQRVDHWFITPGIGLVLLSDNVLQAWRKLMANCVVR